MRPKTFRRPRARAAAWMLAAAVLLSPGALAASDPSDERALSRGASESVSQAATDLRARTDRLRGGPGREGQAAPSPADRFSSAFELGRFAYRSGQFSEALVYWREAAAFLSDPKEFAARLDDLEEALREYRQLQADPSAGPAGLAQAPPEFAAYLLEAARGLKERTDLMRDERSLKAAQESESRQRLNALYLKGRDLYSQGLVEEALKTWEEALPLVRDEKGLRDTIDTLRQLRIDYLAAEERAAQAARERPRVEIPKQMNDLIASMGSLLRQRLDASSADLSRAQEESSRKERLFRETLAEGVRSYEAGDLSAAAAAWKKVLPDLAPEDARRLTEALVSLETGAAALERERGLTRELSDRRDTERYPLPADVSDALSSAAEKLQAAVEDARAERVRAEWELSQRKEWVNTKFEEGKALYAQGKFSKAIEVWEALLPLLAAPEKLRDLIGRFKALSSEYHQQQELARAAGLSVEEIDRILSEQKVLDPKEMAKKGRPGSDPSAS